MKKIQIAFFDIDGTLIDIDRDHISERTREALRRLREKGIRVCVATGRPPATLPDFAGLEFDAFMTFNGSLCYTQEKILFQNPIPAEDVQQLIRNAASLGRPICVATKQRLAANGWGQDLADYYTIAGQTLSVAEDFEAVSRQEVYQLMLGCREEEHPAVLQDVHGARIVAWWDRAADIIPVGGGKGRGIQEILRHFGIPAEEAIAFGDGNNDLEMLQTVGTGVAMGNASQTLKAVADHVCGCAAEDGIYHYCLANGLI